MHPDQCHNPNTFLLPIHMIHYNNYHLFQGHCASGNVFYIQCLAEFSHHLRWVIFISISQIEKLRLKIILLVQSGFRI